MSTRNHISFLAITFTFISSVCFFVHADVFVRSFENCDHSIHDKLKFNLTLKTIGSKQYADGTFLVLAPLDNQLRSNASVHMLVANQWLYLASFTDGKACDGLNKFLGEFWYDLERNAQLMPKQCPIPKGRYRLHNFGLDFNKVPTIGSFPFGRLRVTFMAYDRSNTVYSCIQAETELR